MGGEIETLGTNLNQIEVIQLKFCITTSYFFFHPPCGSLSCDLLCFFTWMEFFITNPSSSLET